MTKELTFDDVDVKFKDFDPSKWNENVEVKKEPIKNVSVVKFKGNCAKVKFEEICCSELNSNTNFENSCGDDENSEEFSCREDKDLDFTFPSFSIIKILATAYGIYLMFLFVNGELDLNTGFVIAMVICCWIVLRW